MIKTPEANLPYEFDWSDWLASGETITSVVIAGTGVTADAGTITNNNRSVVVNVSAGTIGVAAEVKCTVTTNQSHVESRVMEFTIQKRTQ